MRQISSQLTFIYKIVFPVIWFGALGIFTVAIAVSDAPKFLLAVVLAMAIIGYLVLRAIIFPLADEVLDAGDALIVRRARDEIRLPLSQIAEVRYARFHHPERTALILRDETVFGRRISFILPFRINMFVKSPIALDLQRRVGIARP